MTFYQKLKNVQKIQCLPVFFERSFKKGATDYCWLKSALEWKSGISLITGRTHHDIWQCLYSQIMTSTYKGNKEGWSQFLKTSPFKILGDFLVTKSDFEKP